MEFLDKLQEQLEEASRAMADNRHTTASHSGLGPKAYVRGHAYLSGIIAFTVLACASGAIAAATNLFEPDLSSPAPGGEASSMPSAIASSFAIARGTRGPQDVLPAAAVQALDASGSAALHYGVNPGLSRLAGIVNGTNVWLVPGSVGSCMWVQNADAVCAQNDVVSTDGLPLIQIPVSGDPSYVTGILPDGASVTATNSNGTPATIDTSGSAYYVVGQAETTQLEIHTASGTVTSGADVGPDLSSHPTDPGT